MTSPALQEIVALLGCPAAGDPSQYLFERAIEAAGLDWRFVTCDVAATDAAAALAGVAALAFRGCLVSGAIREAALQHVATASPSATFAGAVNLIERRERTLVGHMTEGRGIVEALRAHVDPAERVAIVAGAGPCGRAVALELAAAGVGELLIGDPDATRAASLVESLPAGTPATVIDWRPITVPLRAGILVLTPGDGPLQAVGLRPDLVVADAVAAGSRSPLAAEAVAHGSCLVDAIEIHAVEAAIDFQTLSGVEADVDMLREALEEFFAA
jgi:shikimate dehydrogenase